MNEWFDDFKTAVAFLTRLPMPHPDGASPANFVRAHRMFPVVGALIGAAVGLLCMCLRAIGVPDLAAAALALGASAVLTGALHEDGLADVADGFGGGRTPESKLEIMRDSRLGTYGAMILLVSFAAKLSALAAIRERRCRAGPDRRACAGTRRPARHVVEPALCAQGRVGPQRRPARCDDSGHSRRAGVADRAVVAVMEQRAFRGGAGGLSAGSALRGWRCGRSAARPATCSVAPNRSRRPRSSSCSPQGWRSMRRLAQP